MNPKRNHSRKLFGHSSNEISLPKVFTNVSPTQENLSSKTPNPKVISFDFPRFSLLKLSKKMKNEALYMTQFLRYCATMYFHHVTIEDPHFVRTDCYPAIVSRFLPVVLQYFQWLTPNFATQIVSRSKTNVPQFPSKLQH